MNLREYERAKFELASILRDATPPDSNTTPDEREHIQRLFAKLAEDRFDLVVVGRFSRGKTSLMNALLATDLLPVGLVPLTSVITTVSYGSRVSATIRYEGRRLSTEIALADLPEYVTQQGNPGNVRGVAAAEIRLPAELLRRGFHFIDTPGLGSVIHANTRTTERFLPQADALVLVTSFEGPLSTEELAALCTVPSSNAFVVVNKQDLASLDERDQVLNYVRERLHDAGFADPLRIHSVSARDAAEGRREGDAARVAASGVPALAADLTQFLIEHRQRAFLSHFCDRVGEVIAAGARTNDAGASSRKRLQALVKQLGTPPSPGVSSQPGFGIDGPGARATTQPCIVCRHVASAVFDYLRGFQYALAVEPAAQQTLARDYGLCGLHSWQYATIASVHGICIGYPALLEHLSAELRDLASDVDTPAAAAAQLHARMPTAARCAVCLASAGALADALDRIVGALHTKPSDESSKIAAVCVPHLAMLLSRVGDVGTARHLLSDEAWRLDRVAEDMRRFAIRHDGLRRDLASIEERTSGERAIELVAGLRSLNLAPLP